MVLGNSSNFSQRRVTWADRLDVTPCSYFDKFTEFKLTVDPDHTPSYNVKRFEHRGTSIAGNTFRSSSSSTPSKTQ